MSARKMGKADTAAGKAFEEAMFVIQYKNNLCEKIGMVVTQMKVGILMNSRELADILTDMREMRRHLALMDLKMLNSKNFGIFKCHLKEFGKFLTEQNLGLKRGCDGVNTLAQNFYVDGQEIETCVSEFLDKILVEERRRSSLPVATVIAKFEIEEGPAAASASKKDGRRGFFRSFFG